MPPGMGTVSSLATALADTGGRCRRSEAAVVIARTTAKRPLWFHAKPRRFVCIRRSRTWSKGRGTTGRRSPITIGPVYILLALLTSALYGGADFLGAVASRRAAVLAVSGVSQAAGLLAMLLAVWFLPPAHPVPADFLWGVATGIAGAFSLGFFFSALAIGRIGVVAPIAAAVGASIPVLVGVGLGERLAISAWVGIALAVAAIVLIGWESNPIAVAGDTPTTSAPRLDRSVVLALAAGVAIGSFYSCLQRATAESGLWPLLVARAVSCPLLFLAARVRGQSLGSLRGVMPIVIGSGLLDILANVCYFIAVHHGPLSIIATLASLYPAASVLLAYVILREHLHRRQLVGLAVGTAAIALISGGG